MTGDKERFERVIRPNLVYLTKQVDPEVILDYLVQENCISRRDEQKISRHCDRFGTEAASSYMFQVLSRSEGWYEPLMTGLCENQRQYVVSKVDHGFYKSYLEKCGRAKELNNLEDEDRLPNGEPSLPSNNITMPIHTTQTAEPGLPVNGQSRTSPEVGASPEINPLNQCDPHNSDDPVDEVTTQNISSPCHREVIGTQTEAEPIAAQTTEKNLLKDNCSGITININSENVQIGSNNAFQIESNARSMMKEDEDNTLYKVTDAEERIANEGLSESAINEPCVISFVCQDMTVSPSPEQAKSLSKETVAQPTGIHPCGGMVYSNNKQESPTSSNSGEICSKEKEGIIKPLPSAETSPKSVGISQGDFEPQCLASFSSDPVISVQSHGEQSQNSIYHMNLSEETNTNAEKQQRESAETLKKERILSSSVVPEALCVFNPPNDLNTGDTIPDKMDLLNRPNLLLSVSENSLDSLENSQPNTIVQQVVKVTEPSSTGFDEKTYAEPPVPNWEEFDSILDQSDDEQIVSQRCEVPRMQNESVSEMPLFDELCPSLLGNSLQEDGATYDLDSASTYDLDSASTCDVDSAVTCVVDSAATCDVDSAATCDVVSAATCDVVSAATCASAATHVVNSAATCVVDSAATCVVGSAATCVVDSAATCDSNILEENSSSVQENRISDVTSSTGHQGALTSDLSSGHSSLLHVAVPLGIMTALFIYFKTNQ